MFSDKYGFTDLSLLSQTWTCPSSTRLSSRSITSSQVRAFSVAKSSLRHIPSTLSMVL